MSMPTSIITRTTVEYSGFDIKEATFTSARDLLLEMMCTIPSKIRLLLVRWVMKYFFADLILNLFSPIKITEDENIIISSRPINRERKSPANKHNNVEAA